MNVGGEPIRVFLGSTPSHAVSEALFVRSLLAHASRPLEVAVIDCGRHVLRRPGSTTGQPLPESWRGRLAGASGFSFARYAPPELCGFAGRAIYCEPDQLVLGDVAELWGLPLGDAHLAAVPFEAMEGIAPPYQPRGHLSSVLLFDNARCEHLRVTEVAGSIDTGRLAYSDVISMTEPFVECFGLSVARMPPEWNHLERRSAATRLLHFTDGARRPWKSPDHPEHAVWRQAYLEALAGGHLDRATIAEAWRLGEISRRVRWLSHVPHPLAAPVDAVLKAGERARGRRRQDHRP